MLSFFESEAYYFLVIQRDKKGVTYVRNFIEGFDSSHVFIASAVGFIVADVFALFAGNTISLGMMLLQFAIPTVLALIVYMSQTYYRKKYTVKK